MPQASLALSEDLKAFQASPRPLLLDCAVRSYDWGQCGEGAAIPRLLGTTPVPGKAYAELWIGGHPADPARARLPRGEVPLDVLARSAPEAVLGAAVRARFGDRFPFMMKVLAAAKSLSIQAHPPRPQAEEGFARQESAGIALDDPRRCYKDPHPKPELIAALTPFWALARFRPLEELARVADEAPELAEAVPALRGLSAFSGRSASERREALRDLCRAVLSLPQSRADAALTSLTARLAQAGPFPPERRERWLLAAERDHCPGPVKDRGLFFFFLMNLVRLSPGEALFLAPGEIHAYLSGVGVEVMAGSDNVLRGGLTQKAVDPAELQRALSFDDGRPDVLSPAPGGAYPASAAEFQAARHALAPGRPARRPAERGPDLWLALEGAASFSWSGGRMDLRPGQALLVPAGLGAYETASAGEALLARASTP
jgi:mannose-6-phosphate isomerase